MSRRLPLALAAALASPALAWQLTGADWAWQLHPLQTPLYVHTASFPAAVGPRAEILDALLDAMDTWAAEAQTDFAFRYGGETTQRSWTTDGLFVSQASTQVPAGATLALTQTWSLGADLTECDQRFYLQNGLGPIAWSTDPAGAGPLEIDLQQTAAHELGHCAGLGHSARPQALMYAFASPGLGPADRHLHADDVAGMQAMYGTQPPPGSGLTLDPGGAIVAAASHTYVASGALPGEVVSLLISPTGAGAGPCPAVLAPAGLCLDVLAPTYVLATAVADATGAATFVATLPARAGGATIGLQAGVLRGPQARDSALSESVRARVLPAGTSCLPGELVDCQGRCAATLWLGDGACDDGRGSPRGQPDLDCEVWSYDEGDCAP